MVCDRSFDSTISSERWRAMEEASKKSDKDGKQTRQLETHSSKCSACKLERHRREQNSSNRRKTWEPELTLAIRNICRIQGSTLSLSVRTFQSLWTPLAPPCTVLASLKVHKHSSYFEVKPSSLGLDEAHWLISQSHCSSSEDFGM